MIHFHGVFHGDAFQIVGRSPREWRRFLAAQRNQDVIRRRCRLGWRP